MVGLRTFISPTGDPSRFSTRLRSTPHNNRTLSHHLQFAVTTKHGTILRVRRVFLKLWVVFTRTYSQGVPIGGMAIMLAMIASMGGVSV